MFLKWKKYLSNITKIPKNHETLWIILKRIVTKWLQIEWNTMKNTCLTSWKTQWFPKTCKISKKSPEIIRGLKLKNVRKLTNFYIQNYAELHFPKLRENNERLSKPHYIWQNKENPKEEFSNLNILENCPLVNYKIIEITFLNILNLKSYLLLYETPCFTISAFLEKPHWSYILLSSKL